MNRFGAFATHLGISLVIFAVLGYLIVFHWYPDFFFISDGGWQGIRIVALVDLVLGPTLTLVVYKKGKPSLKFDLTVIALLQTTCLIAGVYVVWSERPIAMVFSDGSFHSMTVDDYRQAGQEVPDLSEFPGSNPRWVSVRLPEDPQQQAVVRKQARTNGTPILTLSAFYRPFDPSHIDVERDGLREFELKRDAVAPYVGQFLDERQAQQGDFLFLPFGTRYQIALIGLRKEDGYLAFLALPGGLTGL
jgi:hypothetical protein